MEVEDYGVLGRFFSLLMMSYLGHQCENFNHITYGMLEFK